MNAEVEVKKKPQKEEFDSETLVRILDKDIRGNKKIIVGLRRIKGISWAFSNAICHILKINPDKKISELTAQEIEIIEKMIKNPEKTPSFLRNRRKDLSTGEDIHLSSTDLELRKEFDIKLLKKIRTYRGLRHSQGLPSRGQRTKSHFRKNKKSKVVVGVKKKKK